MPDKAQLTKSRRTASRERQNSSEQAEPENLSHRISEISHSLTLAQPLSTRKRPPRGWYMAGSEPADYEAGLDMTVAHSGTRSAFLQPAVKNPQGFGTLMQCFATRNLLGKRMRMRAWLKTENVQDWASAWLRVDGEGRGKMLSFDNMCKRRLKGTTDWTEYEIVVDVPPGSINLCFGFMLSGVGKIWADDLSFEEVSADIATTDCPCLNREKRAEPRNLNFEEVDFDNFENFD